MNSVTREHINILHQLGIPFFIVVTKRDLCQSEEILQEISDDASSSSSSSKMKGSLEDSGSSMDTPATHSSSPSKVCPCNSKDCNCVRQLQQHPAYKKTRLEISTVLKGLGYSPVWVENRISENTVVAGASKMINYLRTGKFIPVMVISNKTGFNIPLLSEFFQLLQPRSIPLYDQPSSQNGSTFFSEAFYWKNGIGLILSGTLRGNPVKLNDKLLLGPFDGKWHEIRVRGIHNNLRESISSLEHGQSGCLAFVSNEITRKRQLRVGLVAVSKQEMAYHSREFEAKITILRHSSSITNTRLAPNIYRRYQAVVHCLNIRQTAKMILQENMILRTGDSAIVRLHFLRRPEHIEVGSEFLFCEGSSRGRGVVTAIGVNESDDTITSKNQTASSSEQST
jgi:GTPase